MPSDEEKTMTLDKARSWSSDDSHEIKDVALHAYEHYIDELTAALRETTPWVENDYDARSIAENNRRLLAQWPEGGEG